MFMAVCCVLISFFSRSLVACAAELKPSTFKTLYSGRRSMLRRYKEKAATKWPGG
jgi:hypothetical protein